MGLGDCGVGLPPLASFDEEDSEDYGEDDYNYGDDADNGAGSEAAAAVGIVIAAVPAGSGACAIVAAVIGAENVAEIIG